MKKYVGYFNCFMLGMIIAMLGIYELQYHLSEQTVPVTNLSHRNATTWRVEVFRTDDTVMIDKDTFYLNHSYEAKNPILRPFKHVIK